MMKKTLIAMAVAAGLTAPVMAQNWGYDRYDRDDRVGYDHRIGDRFDRVGYQCENERDKRLYARIRHEVRQGDIDWRRAAELRAAVGRTAEMERRFCARGLNGYQAARLDRQWDRIERLVQIEGRG
jgi:hypothetical protein